MGTGKRTGSVGESAGGEESGAELGRSQSDEAGVEDIVVEQDEQQGGEKREQRASGHGGGSGRK